MRTNAPKKKTTPDANGLAERRRDFERIARAIGFIEDHRLAQPPLDEIAAAVNMSPFHFHRLFSRWAGVSPKRFMGFLTITHARALLEDQASVLDAALEAGLSGPGRLHDLFVAFEAVTPGEAGRLGEGLTIRYGFQTTLFGNALLAATERGLCALSFIDENGEAPALAELRGRWPGARFVAEDGETKRLARAAFPPGSNRQRPRPLPLHVRGTNFQIRVWEALLRIPEGGLVSYAALAGAIGTPKAARAVGNALSNNPIAYLIPCHRVIRRSGAFNAYRWGKERRKAIVGWEAARSEAA